MRLATFGHALRPTSLSIAAVLCVPYRTSLFTFAFIQKIPAREFCPRRPASVCLVCRLGLSKLALICLFPPLCSVFRVHTCLPHLARGPLLPLPLSPSRRLFLRASLISCPLCLRPVSTLGSRSGNPLRDLKVASYGVSNVIKFSGLILNSLNFEVATRCIPMNRARADMLL